MTLMVFEASWNFTLRDLFGLFIRRLVLLVIAGITECPLEVVAIDCRMIGTWIPWAFLLQELYELLLRCSLPEPRRMMHSRDEVFSSQVDENTPAPTPPSLSERSKYMTQCFGVTS
jgi:hypothetical protein